MTFLKNKAIYLTVIIITFAQIVVNGQITDSTLIRKLSVNGICLCNTTLTSLKQAGNNLKEVEVVEMDLSKACAGEDSRYIAGKGYASDKYPGMIFQKDQTTDQVSKIRLTRQFSGKLPDGKFINMNDLKLGELLKMYPKLNNTWRSRGCSDYWNFSNDTLSFFVKIDKNKKPQFPVDEGYYANKPVEGADLMVSCYSFQKDGIADTMPLIDPNDPMFYLDSVRVNRGVLENYRPEEFASVTVYKGADAVKLGGPEAKNGLIYLETKHGARLKYWLYFKSKSAEYAKAVPDPQQESSIQYIVNKTLLKTGHEGDLAGINDKNFKSITVISGDELAKQFGVRHKKYGVIITADIKLSKD